ncbi:type II toxin-antitoxin system Phd/YefM family antitoxin [Microbacterium sp.]|uniref:type II toxin-antitoxin system Phd/YefM family antitoxin n=1 Tax=Microbacterium sp. TaxID=51671 RepID=UPI0039E3DFD2
MSITASMARQTLPAQLDRVEAGQVVEITRHGRVVAVLASPSALRSRHPSPASAAGETAAALLDRLRAKPLAPAALSSECADDLVAQLHAERTARG